MKLELHPIGIIHTPFDDPAGMPIQPAGAAGIQGRIEIFPQFSGGLRDLEGFSHITLIYHFHRYEGYKLIVTPFMDTEPRGLFATRAPRRPNPLGLSTVKLIAVEGNILRIENPDILDGTPLLDIKPYVPDFDEPTDFRLGWLEQARERVRRKKSDDRFE